MKLEWYEMVLGEIYDRCVAAELLAESEGEEYDYYFDFPDYLGLDDEISYKLSSEFVDAVQSCLFEAASLNREEWVAHAIEAMRSLGERIGERII